MSIQVCIVARRDPAVFMSALGIVNWVGDAHVVCGGASRLAFGRRRPERGIATSTVLGFHAGPEGTDGMGHGETGLGVCCASVFPFRVSGLLKVQQNIVEYQ